MSSSTHAQAPERHLDKVILRKLRLRATFKGNDWKEIRPVIITVDKSTQAKEFGTFDEKVLFGDLDHMTSLIVQRVGYHSFTSLDGLVDLVAPLTQTGNHERVQIVAQTPTAVPRAEGGLIRVVNFMRRPPHSDWVISSHEWVINSLKVSYNILSGLKQRNARQMLSLRIRIIGDLEAQAPEPNSAECADMWCRLAKRVCETVEQYVNVSPGKLIESIIILLLARYPVSKVGVGCERLSPLTDLPFAEGRLIEIIRDRQALGVRYVGESDASNATVAGRS